MVRVHQLHRIIYLPSDCMCEKIPVLFPMVEMFTTPREHEAIVVREILKENEIRYICREELRDSGMRYCIYSPEFKGSERVCKIVDEGLQDRDM
jgi:hypothetical protein